MQTSLHAQLVGFRTPPWGQRLQRGIWVNLISNPVSTQSFICRWQFKHFKKSNIWSPAFSCALFVPFLVPILWLLISENGKTI